MNINFGSNNNNNNNIKNKNRIQVTNNESRELTDSSWENIFIVHGHDRSLRAELKDYIQNCLKLPEPIVLSEKMNQGLTIIEKFETYADQAGLVFVLLTPDDFAGDLLRARQNVIFELGYFIGKFGRKSGKIIILLKGEVEIPSDLVGVMYIRVDNGIYAAGEEIRKAIECVKI